MKGFLDYRNVSVGQCRAAAAGVNNSWEIRRGKNLQHSIRFFFFFPFKIQAIADLIYLEDEFS